MDLPTSKNSSNCNNNNIKKKNAFDVMMASAKILFVFDTDDPKMEREKQQRKAYTNFVALQTPPEAFTIGVMGRGQLVRTILATEFPNNKNSNNRGKIMTICINSIPNEMDFVDGLIVIIMLWKVGIINLNFPSICSVVNFKDHEDDVFTMSVDEIRGNAPNNWSYSIDDNGRVTDLSLFYFGEILNNVIGNRIRNIVNNMPTYDLPSIIGGLERLTNLGVAGNCVSLPVKELSQLAHLQTLRFRGCTTLLKNFPVQMVLKRLTYLEVSCSKFKSQSSGPFIKWITRQLQTSLENLTFDFLGKKQTKIIIDFLRNLRYSSFKSKLNCLRMTYCKINGNDLVIIMLDILPKFKDLRLLDLSYNNVETFQYLVDRIVNDNDNNHPISKSIRELRLRYNPVLPYKFDYDNATSAHILSMLKIFKNLYTFGYEYTACQPDIQMAMMINQAGRSIVEDCPDLPLSVWPVVMERAYNKSGSWDYDSIDRHPTGLHYLLRNGPVLIRHLLATNGVSNDNIDKTTTANGSNSSSINNKNALKRKISETDGFVDDHRDVVCSKKDS